MREHKLLEVPAVDGAPESTGGAANLRHCDERCWYAKTPNCRCACGGDNHGQGKPAEAGEQSALFGGNGAVEEHYHEAEIVPDVPDDWGGDSINVGRVRVYKNAAAFYADRGDFAESDYGNFNTNDLPEISAVISDPRATFRVSVCANGDIYAAAPGYACKGETTTGFYILLGSFTCAAEHSEPFRRGAGTRPEWKEIQKESPPIYKKADKAFAWGSESGEKTTYPLSHYLNNADNGVAE